MVSNDRIPQPKILQWIEIDQKLLLQVSECDPLVRLGAPWRTQMFEHV